ncbi:MAG: BrnA antitoxin family protein [Variovorax sp.]
MSERHTTVRIRKDDLPYDPASEAATRKFWVGATSHTGVAELRAKRGRPVKATDDRKEQIALRVDKEVLEWYRELGAGWQTRMNAVLKAYRDATL